ncbi:hypothetical protein AB0M97_22410 [Streptomyces sp. NPDC051207]|uniref:hypothetical protein n=1 Tax=Streptomyces sp. NPDC051207 TaxID=3154641 RepID=UPI0034348026
MDPEVIGLIASTAGTLVAVTATEAFRGILGSILRRPRKTSMIVEVDGERVELSGATAAEARAALEALLAERAAGSAGALETSSKNQPGGLTHRAQTVTGGEDSE